MEELSTKMSSMGHVHAIDSKTPNPDLAAALASRECTSAERTPQSEVMGDHGTPRTSHDFGGMNVRPGSFPLDPTTRAFFEARFGSDLSSVRLHTNAGAQESARMLSARAYAVGSDVVFAAGEYAPGTLRGARVLAHELAHVARGDSLPGGSAEETAERAAERAASLALGMPPRPTSATQSVAWPPRNASTPQATTWQDQLDEILPKNVWLLTVISRVTTLLDVFGEAQLAELTGLIHSDATARAFVAEAGVSAVAALGDTRTAVGLEVAKARDALKTNTARYNTAGLRTLKISPPAPARKHGEPTVWFQDLSSKTAAASTIPTTTAERKQTAVESLSTVGSVNVRFAYARGEAGPNGASPRVQAAKQAVLAALGQVIADIDSYPAPKDQADLDQMLAVRAQLKHALSVFTATRPLNVYIAVDLSPSELLSGQLAATTDRVFVDAKDVGDSTKLQAAVRLPLTMLQGGIMPGAGGAANVPAASSAVLARTLLHESLHVMLIQKNSDAEAIWNKVGKTKLVFSGPAAATSRVEELARKYLISQEELFTYRAEAALYPPVSPIVASYGTFMKGAELFFKQHNVTLVPVTETIPIPKQQVAGHPVKASNWSISFQVPQANLPVTDQDVKVLDLLLSAYPLR